MNITNKSAVEVIWKFTLIHNEWFLFIYQSWVLDHVQETLIWPCGLGDQDYDLKNFMTAFDLCVKTSTEKWLNISVYVLLISFCHCFWSRHSQCLRYFMDTHLHYRLNVKKYWIFHYSFLREITTSCKKTNLTFATNFALFKFY